MCSSDVLVPANLSCLDYKRCDGIISFYSWLDVQMTTAFGGRKVHAMLMVCSLDLPAKAALLNMKQFNGANSCSVCDAPGQTCPGSHLHRFWPFDQEGVF